MFGNLQDYYLDQHHLLAYRVTGLKTAPLEVLEQPADPQFAVKPPAFLVEAGGYLSLPGYGFVDITVPGLYRLYSTSRNVALQWIAHDDCVQTLAASVSSVFYHQANEPFDPSKSKPEQRQEAVSYALDSGKNGKVGGVCTTAADTFAVICNQLAIKSIVWEFENVTSPARLFATHAMTEVFDEKIGRPVLFDIDRGYMFLDENKTPLSCDDFMRRTEMSADIQYLRINYKSFPGFGAGSRGGQIEDFSNDLFAIGGPDFDRDFYRIIGMAEIIFGIQQYGDPRWVTTRRAQARARSALQDNDDRLTDIQRQYLQQIGKFPLSDLA